VAVSKSDFGCLFGGELALRTAKLDPGGGPV